MQLNSILMKRSAAIYRHQTERAGKVLTYTLGNFRAKIAGAEHCLYCKTELHPSTFGADHQIPLSRLGSWELDNIGICCMDCNMVKGPLTADEFTALLACLEEFPTAIAQHTRSRLKAGARICKAPKAQQSDTMKECDPKAR